MQSAQSPDESVQPTPAAAPARAPAPVVARLFASLRDGETRALARAVSLVEDCAPESATILKLCRAALSNSPRALRIGVTGPAGAGKSTLVDALTRELRARGSRVGIVAVDPSSPFSGGAILGDRIRLEKFAGDRGVYMRSMATRGHLGGLSEATDDVLTVIEAAWSSSPDAENSVRDVLLIETTGVGQGEIAVVGLADLVAVVLVPGMGDSIQSLKAGILEIASVFVLNKADREGIDRLESEVSEMLVLSAVVAHEVEPPPIVKTVATTGEGVSNLLAALDSLASRKAGNRQRVLQKTSSPKAAPLSHPQPPVLDHLGIAVCSLENSLSLYAALGLTVAAVEEVAHEQVRVAMLPVGESRIELLEATAPDSPVAKFLGKRGEGLHHIALKVQNLHATVEGLKSRGIRLVSESIQIGAGGHRYVFVHPSSANGVLLELVEESEHGDLH